MGSPWAAWTRHRPLLGQLFLRQLRRRYRGHILGPVWPFLNPLALLVIYTLVFSVFIGIPEGVNADWDTGAGVMGHLGFAAIAYAGLLGYTYITDVLASASTLVRGDPRYVKKSVFPVHLLPPVQAASYLIDLAVGFAFLLVLQTAIGNPPSWHLLLLPVALVPLVLFALAIAWFVSCVAAYIPDFGELVNMFLRVYFFMTPIVYPLELVPQPYQVILYLNPLATILNGIRNVTLFHRPPVWESWLLMVIVMAIAAFASYRLFRRLKPGFADVV